jgi:hypothetical protein
MLVLWNASFIFLYKLFIMSSKNPMWQLIYIENEILIEVA